MLSQDLTDTLQAQVRQAIENKTPLRIVGSNSKAFYGAPTTANIALDISGHRGIIAYDPSELVITVRAGTPLREINELLATQGQMLAFEPPMFSPDASIGGTIACGLSGPRRPFVGSARDFVLGCRILNGHAETLQFGGQVMKNVAGFDVSRLMVGALGQLGVLLDISLRVLPIPESEITLSFSFTNANAAITQMQNWQVQPWPISALSYHEKQLWLRLSGAETAVKAAAAQLGGNLDSEGTSFWQALREQQLKFFLGDENLWRVSISPATPMFNCPGSWLLEWGGALRWLKSALPATDLYALVAEYGGHALCFRSNNQQDWLRLSPELLALHKQIRLAFDPHRIFNPQRFTPEL